MRKDRETDIVRAFIIGAVLGTAAGILFARKDDRETLAVLYRRAETLLTRVQNDYERAAETIRQTYETISRRRGNLPPGEKVS